MAVIILNVLVMATTHAGMNNAWQDFMSYANLAFTAFFTVEAVLKVIALGLRQYIRVSVTSAAGSMMVQSASCTGPAVDLAAASCIRWQCFELHMCCMQMFDGGLHAKLSPNW